MNNKFSQKAFTLIETLMALFIFSTIITGSLAIITLNLANASSIKNSFIASGLVQEGAELVRNLRDNDWFATRPFGAFGAATTLSDGPYRVQWNALSLTNNSDNPFLQKADGDFYSYGGGSPTVFKRNIQLTRISDSEIKMVVEVTWLERGLPKKVTAEQHVYNWY